MNILKCETFGSVYFQWTEMMREYIFICLQQMNKRLMGLEQH